MLAAGRRVKPVIIMGEHCESKTLRWQQILILARVLRCVGPAARVDAVRFCQSAYVRMIVVRLRAKMTGLALLALIAWQVSAVVGWGWLE